MLVKHEIYFADLSLERLAGVQPDPEDASGWRGIFVKLAPPEESTVDSST